MNGEDLVDAVGSLINISEPDTNTNPSSTEILGWLNQAQDMIARNVPADDLQSLWDVISGTRDLGSDILRVISVTIDGDYSASWVPQGSFGHLRNKAEADSDKAIWAYSPRQEIVDQYWDTGMGSTLSFGAVDSGLGQCFEVAEDATLSRIRLRIRVNGTPADGSSMIMRIYTMSGTWGSTGVPSSTLCATAELPLTAIPVDGAWHERWFEFPGVNRFNLLASQQYYTWAVTPNHAFGTTVTLAIDSSSPTHGGNCFYKTAGVWAADASWDFGFDVVGVTSSGTDDQEISIDVAPTSTSDAYEVVVLRRPESFTDADTRPTMSVPDIYDQVLILYAVAMAKIKDEEMPDAQYLLQVVGSVLGRGNLPDDALRQGG
jgi:hypothetical protein